MYSNVSALNTLEEFVILNEDHRKIFYETHLMMASPQPTKINLADATIQFAVVVRHMTHLSSSRLELNSTRCPLRVIAGKRFKN